VSQPRAEPRQADTSFDSQTTIGRHFESEPAGAPPTPREPSRRLRRLNHACQRLRHPAIRLPVILDTASGVVRIPVSGRRRASAGARGTQGRGVLTDRRWVSSRAVRVGASAPSTVVKAGLQRRARRQILELGCLVPCQASARGVDVRELQTDYLVVGAGATGMAFTDVLISESDVSVVMVDRRHRPGGHWNDGYPFVRLHQPSVLYGVLSRPLGLDRIDESGANAGFYERATGPELCAYYGQVLDEQLIQSGQVRFYGMHDYLGGRHGEHHLRSRLTGAMTTMRVRRRLVDATYIESAIPATHSPPFLSDPDAVVVTPNDLVSLPAGPPGFTVIGAGKTAMDTCCWLVDNGVDPDRIRWIRARDPWTNDRAVMQPLRLVGGFVEWVAAMTAACAAATDLRDMCLRMEDGGALVRLDPGVEPTCWRGAILSATERATLSGIGRVVRMGHVRHVGTTAIELEQGTIPTEAGHVHIDCTAAGVGCLPNRTVFQHDRITLQYIQTGNAPCNAALIGWAEANRDDDAERNLLCPPNGFTAAADARNLAQQWATTQRATTTWSAEPDLRSWLSTCRLSPFGNARPHLDDKAINALTRTSQHRDAAAANLDRLLAPLGTTSV
jgi:hypothetical protein